MLILVDGNKTFKNISLMNNNNNNTLFLDKKCSACLRAPENIANLFNEFRVRFVTQPT